MARWSPLCAVIVLLATSVAAEPLADDPEGDHEVTAGGAAPVTGARWDALDLVSLDVAEEPEAFRFTLGASDLRPPGEDLVLIDGIDWFVHFTYREAEYRINFYRVGNQPISSGYIFGATLDLYDAGSDRWATTGFYDASVADGTMTVSIPRGEVVGADGAGVVKGAELTGIHVVSALFMEQVRLVDAMGQSVDYPVEGRDRMPDEGVRAIEVQEGIEQSGTASLASGSPVRVSNGEATTMLFTVTARNDAQEQQLFALRALDVPDHWTVTFPAERLRLGAGEGVDVPVLVTTPFNHEHGAFYSMMVELQSQQDPSATGRIELGIRYTRVPQPAGHHDRAYIHIDGGGRPYFNTLEDDPADTGEAARDSGGCGCGDQNIYRYDVALLPGLRMGLDFDLERNGSLELPLRFDIPVQDVRVYGDVVVYPEGQRSATGFFGAENEYAVATISHPGTIDFEADTPKSVLMAIEPTAYGDYLPFQPDAGMTLDLYVAVPAGAGFCCLGPDRPHLEPGGRLQLPLDEYHDDVDEYFSSLTGVELYAVGGQEALVNPGKTVVFNATLENVGKTAGEFELSLTGNHADWARVLGSTRIEVPAGSSRELAVAVVVPGSARDGEQADIALHAASVDDDNVRTLLRFVAHVDEDEDIPDQADIANALDGTLRDDKKSPLHAVAALAAVAAAVVLRRRRG